LKCSDEKTQVICRKCFEPNPTDDVPTKCKSKKIFFLFDVLKKAGEGNQDRNEKPFKESMV